jgi:hypothetical protein
MYSSKTPKLPTNALQKKAFNSLNSVLPFFIASVILLITGCSSSETNSSSTSTDDSTTFTNQPFGIYSKESQKNLASLNENYQNVRQRILDEVKGNPVYKTLVDQKIIDQKYLVVLQAIGNSMISEHDNVFDIDQVYENQFKAIPGALKFTINIIQLDIYGGVPKDILDVYARYVNTFRVSGNKGNTIYHNDGAENTIIEYDFTLTEALAIFHYNYPLILDDFYDAEASGLTDWQGGKGANYRYAYLNTRIAFNDYLGKKYPNSKNYVTYDTLTTASNLYADYDANEVTADDKYKNKKIAVKGIISSIAKDFMDKPYITLTTGDHVSEIQCYFNNGETLKKLSKGDGVIIIGTCTGKVLVSVGLSDCRIL